jgi:amino acid transporter
MELVSIIARLLLVQDYAITYFSFNSLFTAGTLTGFDASGHIAEETKNARIIAGKGILSSCIATGVLGFITTILFLFCTPDFDTLFSLNAPQPFVQVYALALGKPGSAFMTAIAVVGLVLVSLPVFFLQKDIMTELIPQRIPVLPLSLPPVSYLRWLVTVSSRCLDGLARWTQRDSPRTR